MKYNYFKGFMTLVTTCMMTFTTTAHAQKYVGGDISALPTNELKSPTYYDKHGNTVSDPLDIFKSEEMNAMRVRLFVKPTDFPNNDPFACQDLDYVKSLGKRIKDAGFKLMLDFHYSDTWADPAKQWTPKAWENLTDEELYQKIYEYTKDALLQLKSAGAEPDFIQTGNEISYGMLWGKEGNNNLKKCFMGSTANWSRFTTLLSEAGKACREVCPNAKIVLHTERAAQTNVLTNFYDKMKDANIDYDIIGLSYYPIWHNNIATLETAINTLETRYTDKDIMIVEVGAAYSWLPGDKDYTPDYATTENGQKQFTDDLIAMLNKHNKVTGLFWWWMDYNAYPWDTTRMDDWWYAPLIDSNTGKPLAAMSSLKNFLDGSTDIRHSIVDKIDDNGQWFTVSGQPAGQNPTKPGLYVRNGKKKIVERR